MKKILSFALSFAMILSLFSFAAFAEESTTEVNSGSNESTISKIFSSGLYVKADPNAGLDGDVDVTLSILDGAYNLYLPGSADASKLYLSWDSSKITLSIDGIDYESGMAPIPAAGESITYTVKKNYLSLPMKICTVKGSESVEAMYITVDESRGTISDMNSDSEHETSCYGSLKLGGGKTKYMSIKGRGNSTWIMDKKPYNITIYKDEECTNKKKAEFIEGVESKKWSLLANYFDNSLLRNKVAMDLAENLGIGLETKFVDLWMNGEYLGNYLLTPKKDYNCSDDGFIIENDHIDDDDNPDQFDFPDIAEMPLKHNRINVDDIGDNAADTGCDNAYIESWFTEAWDTVLDYDSEEYQKYFDLESWAKMYLMFEVSKTYDCYAGNIIMHRDGLEDTDLLYAGPAWDYDIAFGRTLHKFFVGVDELMQVNAEGWYNDSIGECYTWIDEPVSILQGLDRHISFRQKVAEVYKEYQWAFETVDSDIATQAELIRDSANMNNAKYTANSLCADYVITPEIMSLLGTGEYALNYKVTTAWDDYVYNFREYCNKRIKWMTDNIDTIVSL